MPIKKFIEFIEVYGVYRVDGVERNKLKRSSQLGKAKPCPFFCLAFGKTFILKSLAALFLKFV